MSGRYSLTDMETTLSPLSFSFSDLFHFSGMKHRIQVPYLFRSIFELRQLLLIMRRTTSRMASMVLVILSYSI